MKKQCSQLIVMGSFPYHHKQCSRKVNGNGKFCTPHDPAYIKKKDDEKYKQRQDNRDNRDRMQKFNIASTQFVKRVAAGKFKDEDDAFKKARAICKKHNIECDGS